MRGWWKTGDQISFDVVKTMKTTTKNVDMRTLVSRTQDCATRSYDPDSADLLFMAS